MKGRTPIVVWFLHKRKKRSHVKRNGLSTFLDNNLKSSFMKDNLPKKKNLSIGYIYSILPRLKKINREAKFCFLVGDFNVNLMKTFHCCIW